MKKEVKEKKENLEQYDFPWNEDEIIFKPRSRYPKVIGELLIAFSNLESSLNLFLSEIISDRSDELGYLIIKSLTYNNKVSLAKELCLPVVTFKKGITEKNRKHLNHIIKKLYELGKFRNSVVHANWMTLDKDGFVRTKITQDESGFVVFKNVRMTPALISRRVNQCNVTASGVYDLRYKILKK